MSNNENLKPQIIDYCLKSLTDRKRQMLKDNLCDFAQQEFVRQLAERNDDADSDGRWFVDSIIDELTIVHGFTYLSNDGKMIGLTPLGERVRSMGYIDYMTSVATAQEEKEKAEAQERSWNTRNNIVSCVLGAFTVASMVWGWLCPEQGSKLLPVLTFVAGCLSGYATNNLRRNRRLRRRTASQ